MQAFGGETGKEFPCSLKLTSLSHVIDDIIVDYDIKIPLGRFNMFQEI